MFDARRLVVDHRAGRLTIEHTDGSLTVRAQQVRAPEGAVRIVRSEFLVATRELLLTLPSGQRVVAEVGLPGVADRPPDGKPVVYLDQNHWIALARRRFAPERNRPDVNAAADSLEELAQRRAIILPLSSGHLAETARSDGRHRHDLATTMLSLSRGWQMRSPVAVRVTELAAAVRGLPTTREGIFTLEPGGVFATGRRYESQLDLPEDARDLYERITWASALFDLVIEDEKHVNLEAEKLALRWADGHATLATQLREQAIAKDQIRLAAFGMFISDLRNDFARAGLEAGMDPADFFAWMRAQAETELGRLPHLGRLRELILLRLRNADERWEANDFNDALYLSCAAGYADLVVGERKHTNLLLRTEHLVPEGAALVRTLPAAVEWLRTEATAAG